jgi:hypothetical protein
VVSTLYLRIHELLPGDDIIGYTSVQERPLDDSRYANWSPGTVVKEVKEKDGKLQLWTARSCESARPGWFHIRRKSDARPEWGEECP